MFIQKLTLSNFRCFKEKEFHFSNRLVVIEGRNGVGKSSLIEALHYSCYLRSFRTHLHRDLVNLDDKFFFVGVDFQVESSGVVDQISVGFSPEEGKVVKYNQKPVQSYKELISSFRVVTLSADDLLLVNGAPEYRRNFLNYALFLKNPECLQQFKRYKNVLEQRNQLLLSAAGGGSRFLASDELFLWTQKLWEESRLLQLARVEYLKALEARVNSLLKTYFVEEGLQLQIEFEYLPKNVDLKMSFDGFWAKYQQGTLLSELDTRRSLFGVHLDDFAIRFQDKRARTYASRGQQKLIVFLIKVAQLEETCGEMGVLLLDDFVTDFDQVRLSRCMTVLKNFPYQIFLTCPQGAVDLFRKDSVNNSFDLVVL